MTVRVKITEAMIDAGVAALMRFSEEEAMRRGEPVPDFDGMAEEQKRTGRDAVKAILRAGADAL